MSGFKVALIANDIILKKDEPPVLPDWVRQRLDHAEIDFVYHECYTRADLEKCASDADVIWMMAGRKGLVVEENMDIFKKACAVVKQGSGTDNIDHQACTKRGIIIAHSPEDATEPTSDHAIAMLLTAVRQTARHDRLLRRGIWDRSAAFPIGFLTGADLGIVGFGRIGRAIARKLSGFHMQVRVYDPYVEQSVIAGAGAFAVRLEELLRESQFVILSCPLTQETQGLLGEPELKMMRPDAVLVNCARGGIVDEKALIRALKGHRIAAAALDVFTANPIETHSELLSLDNVTLTPHLGGCPPDLAEVFRVPLEEIIELSQMRLPKWIANKEVVPRWNLKR